MAAIVDTLYDFLYQWLTNSGFREQYDNDVQQALERNGLEDVGPAELADALPLVAEDLPLQQQQQVFSFLNAASTDSGSTFNVDQGGAAAVASQAAAAASADAVAQIPPLEARPGEEPIEAAARSITHITNNIQNTEVNETNVTNIDDSGDVTQTVNAFGEGDVDFDSVVASGDGAVAADGDVQGVNTGVNTGILAGDDVEDAELTNVDVSGDDNTVVTGDDNLVGDDNILGDDNTVGDGNIGDIGSDATFGDGNVNIDGDVDASQGGALAFGEGDAETDVDVEDSFNDDSFNDTQVDIADSAIGSTVDSGNIEVEDSFNDDSLNEAQVNVGETAEGDFDVEL